MAQKALIKLKNGVRLSRLTAEQLLFGRRLHVYPGDCTIARFVFRNFPHRKKHLPTRAIVRALAEDVQKIEKDRMEKAGTQALD